MEDFSLRLKREQSPPRRQRACVPCSTAKAKCHFQEANVERHVCDRCQKLSIACVAKASKGLRKPRQIKPLNSRVSNLEKQLESLSSALESRNALAASSSFYGVTPDSHVSPAVLTPESLPAVPSASHHSPQQRGVVRERGGPAGGADSQPPFGLTWHQAGLVLDRFRDKYVRYFPYVIIEKGVTAKKLYKTKPFLFRAVMLVAAPLPVPRVEGMKREVMSYLGQHLFVEEERTLDILQGILVCVAWGDLNHLHDEQVTTLTHTALGYAHNLGLTKAPFAVLQEIGMDDTPDDMANKKGKGCNHVHSLEEQRTLLGTFLLLATNSNQFGRQSPLKGPYIDICVNALVQQKERPSDFVVERNIKMMQVGEKISSMFGAASDRVRGKPYLFLVEENVVALRAELDAVMESTESLQSHTPEAFESGFGSALEQFDWQDRDFKLEYNYLLVRLYEPATYLKGFVQDGISPSEFMTTCLRNCLFAAEQFFSTLFLVAPWQYVYQSITANEKITFVLVITTRLLLMDSPDWDVELARSTINLSSVMTRIIASVEAGERERVQEARRFAEDADMAASPEELAAPGRLADSARKATWIRDWFDARVARDASSQFFAGDLAQGWFADGMELDLPGLRRAGGAPMWFSGMLSNSAWNFDDLGGYQPE